MPCATALFTNRRPVREMTAYKEGKAITLALAFPFQSSLVILLTPSPSFLSFTFQQRTTDDKTIMSEPNHPLSKLSKEDIMLIKSDQKKNPTCTYGTKNTVVVNIINGDIKKESRVIVVRKCQDARMNKELINRIDESKSFKGSFGESMSSLQGVIGKS